MDFQRIEKKHYKMTVRINTGLMITHMMLLCMFAYLHVTYMVYVNIASISIYVLLYFYYKKNLMIYVFIVYLEVLAHMSAATVAVGWAAGFQLYCICLIPCIFLCDYLGQTDQRKTIYPVTVSALTMLDFVILKLICDHNVARYSLESAEQYRVFYIFNAVVTFIFLVIYMYLFESHILKKEKQLSNMAGMDELTKLPNRYLMRDWLKEGFTQAGTNEMAVAILDIDDFKQLNDQYGHMCGDLVLKNVAKELHAYSAEIRVCRWGGEEFVFLKTGEHAYENLLLQMQTLCEKIKESKQEFQRQPVPVTVTIGVDAYCSADISELDCLKRADENLYQGKSNGKMQVVGKNIIQSS